MRAHGWQSSAASPAGTGQVRLLHRSAPQRTCAGTHTIHSALRLSQISVWYLCAAADRGWPDTTALIPKKAGK